LYDLCGSGKITREDAIKAIQVLGYKINKEDMMMINNIIAAGIEQPNSIESY